MDYCISGHFWSRKNIACLLLLQYFLKWYTSVSSYICKILGFPYICHLLSSVLDNILFLLTGWLKFSYEEVDVAAELE